MMPGAALPARAPAAGIAERKRLDGADFEPADFFVLRTPLLPFDELEVWGARLRAPHAADDASDPDAALRADRRDLRRWLEDLLSRPVVLEALHLASPGLLEALDYWRQDPESKKGRRAEEALVRYAERLTSRATPFGLFAGCTLGRVGGPSRLRLEEPAAHRRHSRLDADYLFSLAQELNRDRRLRRSLEYRPSSSLYRAGGRLRYAEARFADGVLSHHLVAVEPDVYLESALARAEAGASVHEVAAAVAASDPDGEIAQEEAEAYVHQLIDTQILVSDLWPAVTGAEAVHGLIETLERSGHGGAAVLDRACRELEALDREGLGVEPARYREVAGRLEALPDRPEARHLFQVDLLKPGDAALDPVVLDEIARGIEVLHRFAGRDRGDSLAGFRDRFLDRYGEGRLVPLVEALDDEAGVGFPSGSAGADASPLLDGLRFPSPESRPKGSWGPRDDLLFEKVTQALATGAPEIEITERDLDRLEPEARPPLPDSFQAMVKVAAASEEAFAEGRFRVWVKSVFGPSGARIAGRFCHADERLLERVRDHLRAEEALEPEALFAEVVHLPSGRIGNVASRPLLRGWEIPFLGVSGAPRERQIPVDDLRVTVAGSEVVLVSARLRRRVIPRLTSAHNYVFGSLAVYRFLGSLQGQGVRTGLPWDWGPFDRLPYLPRVCSGRVVLSHARWRVSPEEIADLARRRGADRYRAARRWREERGIPRQTLLADDDAELFVDLDNVLSLEAFLPVVRKSDDIVLTELWPAPAELPVHGPGGRFAHELVVPFERRRAPSRRPPVPAPVGEVERAMAPTSGWLYLKLFTGAATADLVLRDLVAPLVSRARESGAADRWFFLRYGDPHWHLRVRLGGEPGRLRSVVDLLAEVLDPALRDGRVWRWQLDTYDREVERYGGPAGVELAERMFAADSDAVLAILESLDGDVGAEARWRLALVGVDRLLADFGLDLAARRDALAAMRATFAAELDPGGDLNPQLARRLREVGDELHALVTARQVDPEHPLADGLAALERRSQALAPLVAELRALEARDGLSRPVAQIVPSHAHMFVNRLIRSDHRAHELVLYDFLHRITVSRIARQGAAR